MAILRSMQCNEVPPSSSDGHWKLKYGWQDSGIAPLNRDIDTGNPEAVSRANQEIDLKISEDNRLEIGIPFDNHSSPGIHGTVRRFVRRVQ
jgi:hypothetical protein